MKINKAALAIYFLVISTCIAATSTFLRDDGTFANPSPSDISGTSGGLGFYFHKNGTNQTGMLTGAYDRITWATFKFNTTSNGLSGNRWTAPTSGIIFMEVTTYYTAHVVNSAASNNDVKVIKNSAGTCNGVDVFGAQGMNFFSVSGFATNRTVGFDNATAGDVYEVCSFAVSDDALNDIQIDGNMAHTHWSGAYIR
jgi:hypothetical protein